MYQNRGWIHPIFLLQLQKAPLLACNADILTSIGIKPLVRLRQRQPIGVDLLSFWDGQKSIRFRLFRCCLCNCVVVLDHDSAVLLVMLSI